MGKARKGGTRMSTRKNPMREKITEFYKELKSFRKFSQICMKALTNVSESSILTVDIGFLIQEMPKTKHLIHKENYVKGVLRKVCSGEMSAEEAYNIVEACYLQIIDTMLLFDEAQIYKK